MTKRFAVVDSHGAGFGRYATHGEAGTHAEGLHAASPSQTFEVFVLDPHEYLTVEIDTDAKTCVVVEKSR